MRTAWLLLCLPHAALAAPWLRSEGVATSAQGDILYREVHWRREATEGAERWVLYQCPDGRPFARKHLPASARPQARSYSLQDRRSGRNRRSRRDWRLGVDCLEGGCRQPAASAPA